MTEQNLSLIDEVKRRRTFAIISHPDAGKTTLTEKFLLYGGAIREAGSVKSRRSQKHAVSDWMEIEKQRGISVASSVLQFEYNNFCINILDTPGHQDFSEDTYRTLMAADSAVMVIDSAKGVEDQTKKLFQVCKMRGIPIFTFINKMDRQGKDPFELLEDIENVLGIRSCPVNWPIGSGKDFKGVFNRHKNQIEVFDDGNHGQDIATSITGEVSDEKFNALLGSDLHEKLLEDIELLDIAGDEFNLDGILKGELTPVFFGSALTNFGVEPFLESFLEITSPPSPRSSNLGDIDPNSNNFSGFIFKIQANMDKNHRDRIAFLRICSGKFEKGMTVTHVQRGKKIKLSQPQQFVAQDRVMIDSAYPGDIIGIHDPGIFNIGDTLSEKQSNLQYTNIPQFAPEHFMRVSTKNALKRKQFVKGLTQLAEEGAIQVYRQPNGGMEELIIGVVGVLQFEVLEYRLKQEYNVEILMNPLSYRYVRWIENDLSKFGKLSMTMDTLLVEDKNRNPVLLLENEWTIRHLLERNEGLLLRETSL
ncbi:MAG: peptide chain release factor 3 [Paraclostridium sordellii]|uniref:peptide chain release factor 3 n=1 Tax=Paraclostridium sordellii TaxID=1505 RepID=UPI00054259C4|nr:peptide chain release factor 3 [Paeniclostridium sordellii]AUN14341.1 peptide chain release factor 3 [Paeniclostridium sordellii]MDU6113431.1 peptide chain release factor 3 [Paeniclostridium sordellii]MDU6482125.1 peptide chain release factor 3 [Paeniclostridium sordellii]CEK33892.1 peptide chain release factor 3,Peptide chain release factor 3,peptide chain release factor 3,GTPases-translation elongation factors,peptide chain release factor 3,Elongation factor Tu GTP binding domain [[Clostri